MPPFWNENIYFVLLYFGNLYFRRAHKFDLSLRHDFELGLLNDAEIANTMEILIDGLNAFALEDKHEPLGVQRQNITGNGDKWMSRGQEVDLCSSLILTISFTGLRST